MIEYSIQLFLTIWAAISVRLINRQWKWALWSGLGCNACFLSWWIFTGQLGFLVGDLIFTMMYLNEIKQGRTTYLNKKCQNG